MALGHWVMKGSALALIMLAFANRFTILALLSLILISPLNNAQQEEINAWEVDGGHSVIMEQYTATWCDICASVEIGRASCRERVFVHV
jgi:hypothetical protein